ncbi:MAG: acyl-CoA dehydrogenase, partial [Kordiimonadales bacterium]
MALDLETRNQLIDMLDRFVTERLIPSERRMEEEGRVPEDIAVEMRELGLFGISIPEEYGGLGLSLEDEVEVALVIGRAAPAFR